MTPRGAIAGGGRLKLIFRTDNCKRLGVHCLGDDGTTTLTGHVVDQAELSGCSAGCAIWADAARGRVTRRRIAAAWL
jgi:hypothetical protein